MLITFIQDATGRGGASGSLGFNGSPESCSSVLNETTRTPNATMTAEGVRRL